MPAESKVIATRNKTMSVATTAELTCPICGVAQESKIPTDSCQFFYDCVGCGSVLRPKEGNCCVFCSYVDEQCPSKQNDSAGYRGIPIS